MISFSDSCLATFPSGNMGVGCSRGYKQSTHLLCVVSQVRSPISLPPPQKASIPHAINTISKSLSPAKCQAWHITTSSSLMENWVLPSSGFNLHLCNHPRDQHSLLVLLPACLYQLNTNSLKLSLQTRKTDIFFQFKF